MCVFIVENSYEEAAKNEASRKTDWRECRPKRKIMTSNEIQRSLEYFLLTGSESPAVAIVSRDFVEADRLNSWN